MIRSGTGSTLPRDDPADDAPKKVDPAESGFEFDPAHAFETFDLSSITDPELRKKTEDGLLEKVGKQKTSKKKDLEPSGTPVSNALDVRVRCGKMKCGAKTEVYSRVCGYFRPVSNWNKGKKEEFKERKTFLIKKGLPN